MKAETEKSDKQERRDPRERSQKQAGECESDVAREWKPRSFLGVARVPRCYLRNTQRR